MKHDPQIPDALAPGATGAEAAAWVRRLVRFIGPGFHPDTPFDDYVAPDRAKSFTAPECASLEQGLAKAWDILDQEDIEIYAVALPVQRRMLSRR